jgi:phenylpropionate dioxygenase-like ring-hydroxylating dioxygenase large terminal subunit
MEPMNRMRPPETKPHTSVFHVPNAWYVVSESKDLKSTPRAFTLLGTPLVIFRTASGQPAALLDRCPHRNVPLSCGKVRGEHVECAYHGWQFDRSGACRAIPGLIGEATHERGRRTPAYPCVERDGFVWVWGSADVPPDREPFAFPTFSDPRYTVVDRMVEAPGTLHATLENALDVPHTAFLHGGLFRTEKTRNEIEAVVRRFHDRAEVEYIGEPRPTGLVGRILSPSGGTVIHFDRFFLPGVAQVEYRIGDENHFLVTAAATPISDFRTLLFARIQFRTRFPGAVLKPVLEPIALRIFAQDSTMLSAQTKLIQTFGGEQFESTEIDFIGPHIYRLLRDAERGTPAEPSATPNFEKRVRFMA